MAIVPKPDNTMRPVIDPTKAGLNDCLAPWGMQLPTPKELLQHLPAKAFLGKRDWKHGFHQMTLAPESRRFMGFRHPENGRIGRFVALPFGAAQSPGRFTDAALTFARLLFQRAKTMGLETVGLAQYIDDILMWATNHRQLLNLRSICDTLAQELGVSFKSTKDEGFDESNPMQKIDWIGYTVDTTGEQVIIRPQEQKR